MFVRAQAWVSLIVGLIAVFLVFYIWHIFAGGWHAVGLQIRGIFAAFLSIINGIFGTHFHLP